jgi:hypothetical protein
MNHHLHERIGKLLGDALKDSAQALKIIKDPACCADSIDKQHIPLFLSEDKSRATRFCCVDLLILQDDKIRIIVEIEESDIKPTQVCGKFIASALSNYYIHKKEGKPKEMAESVAFIQVLDSSKLKDRTAKLGQFRLLEESIQQVLPLKGRRFNRYKLFAGKSDDSFAEMIKFIKDELGP